MDEFSFPYDPYDIQQNLMKEIFSCIEDGQVGIFESPTGTGKSLSVLCSTLTWLEKHEVTYEGQLIEKAKLKKQAETIDDQDWIAAFSKARKQNIEADDAQKELDTLNNVRNKIRRAESNSLDSSNFKNGDLKKRKANSPPRQHEERDDVAPDDYNSDEESLENSPEEVLKAVKVIYASRTHSQLEQLIEELHKTRFKPRVVTAASRQALCANMEVQRLKINHLINERCMELRKNSGGGCKKAKQENGSEKRGTSRGCCYYSQNEIEDLVDGILSCRLQKPNEVLSTGRKHKGCPYFATRKAIPLCQLVLVPYQVLLHEGTRNAWGINVEGNVLVIDEAHNVLQTIGNLYSSEIAASGIKLAISLCNKYLDTYRTRLKAKNLMYMRQLVSVLSGFEAYLSKETSEKQHVTTIQGLIIACRITDINLFKLLHYMEATDLCKKFHGFFLRQLKARNSTGDSTKEAPKSGVAKLLSKCETPQESDAPAQEERVLPSPMFAVKSFLESLSNRCEDGRIIVDRNTGKMKFILLNPGERLRSVVTQARATILVGGTMEPSQLLVDSLRFSGPNAKEIRRFSCSHVIEDNQLLALAVGKTSGNCDFTLTYQTRSNVQVLKSLGQSIIEIAGSIPNGIVVFFPSYDFMYTFVNSMKGDGSENALQANKSFFTEPRGPCNEIWQKFADQAKTKRGAILFAVVGGKLSEGINFSDELGRGVVVVGLPYANMNSLELKEQMTYLDKKGQGRGRLLYESMCMHSVNQAIGRAIRHRRDYAAIILLDQRFSKPQTFNQLSGWIKHRLQIPTSFSEALQATTTFFKNLTELH